MKQITDYLCDGLSVRAYNCLARAGVTDLNELSNWTCDDLRNVRNLGKKQYQEIIDICHKNGIYLKQESVSMKFVNVPKEAVLDEVAKSEVIKEFAERLKEEVFSCVCCDRIHFEKAEYELDNLVKEMTEEK